MKDFGTYLWTKGPGVFVVCEEAPTYAFQASEFFNFNGVESFTSKLSSLASGELNTRNYYISYVAEEMMVRTEVLHNGENKELEFMVPVAESPRFRTMFFEQRRRYAEVNFGTFIFNPLTAKVC